MPSEKLPAPPSERQNAPAVAVEYLLAGSSAAVDFFRPVDCCCCCCWLDLINRSMVSHEFGSSCCALAAMALASSKGGRSSRPDGATHLGWGAACLSLDREGATSAAAAESWRLLSLAFSASPAASAHLLRSLSSRHLGQQLSPSSSLLMPFDVLPAAW